MYEMEGHVLDNEFKSTMLSKFISFIVALISFECEF